MPSVTLEQLRQYYDNSVDISAAIVHDIDPTMEYVRRLTPSSVYVFQVRKRKNIFVLKVAIEGIGRFLRQLEPKMIIAAEKVSEQIHKDLGLAIDRTEKVTVKRKDIPSAGMTLTCITT